MIRPHQGTRPRCRCVLAAELADVQADPAFAALFDLRNTQYHRWRGESPGATGVDLKGATIREALAAGEAVGISSQLLPAYTEGQHALDELVRVTRDALNALVAQLPRLPPGVARRVCRRNRAGPAPTAMTAAPARGARRCLNRQTIRPHPRGLQLMRLRRHIRSGGSLPAPPVHGRAGSERAGAVLAGDVRRMQCTHC